MKKVISFCTRRFIFLKGALILSLLTSTSGQGWGMDRGKAQQPDDLSDLSASIGQSAQPIQLPFSAMSLQEGGNEEVPAASVPITNTQVENLSINSAVMASQSFDDTNPQDVPGASIPPLAQSTPIKRPEIGFQTPKDQVKKSGSVFVTDGSSDSEDEAGYQTPDSIDERFFYSSDPSTDSESSIDPQDDYQLEKPVSLLNAETQKTLEKLNKEMDFDWNAVENYPNLYIVHYRGFHYLKDRFSTTARRVHRKIKHAGKTTYSPAVHDLADVGFGTPIISKADVSKGLKEVGQGMGKLSASTPVKAHWKTNGDKLFSSPLDAHHQRLSNSYDGYYKDAKSGKLSRELGGINSPESPYVAAADGPYHALRYAFGLKLPDHQRPFAFRARYNPRTGRPRHFHLGKVVVFAHSLPEYKTTKARHVPTLGALGLISPETRALDESETTFQTLVDGGNVIFEEPVRIPSLSFYRPYYQNKYGLSESKFNEWKREIANAPSDASRIEAEKRLCDHIAYYQSHRLLRKAKSHVEDAGGVLVYQKVPSGYALTPPDLKEARRLHKINFPKKQTELRKSYGKVKEEVIALGSDDTTSSKVAPKKLFEASRPQFFGKNKDQILYLGKNNGATSDKLKSRLLSHRNNRYIRRLLLRDMRLDSSELPNVGQLPKNQLDKNFLKRSSFKDYIGLFSELRGQLSGRGMAEAASHVWQLGKRIGIQFWAQDEQNPHGLKPTIQVGQPDSSTVLNVLEIPASGEIPRQQYHFLDQLSYEYNGVDIANLLELGVVQQIAEQHGAIQHQQFDQGMIPIDPEDVDLHHAGIIHQVGNHHILPPIELAHGNTLQSHIENFLNNLAHQGIAAPTSIIIPYNPGGHWVTVHIQITDNQIKLLYIESLLGFQDRKNRLEIGQKMETLRNFLEVRYERHTIIDIVYRKLQSDSYACGPITVEVVQEIAFNALIPALPQQLNAAAIMVLRDRHVQLLHEHGRDLDFDPI